MHSRVAVFLLALLVVSAFAGLSAVEGRRTQAVSVWSGVYTTAEAEAGEKIYYARCSSCHGDELEGRERATALAGPQFLDVWHGKDLRRLLDRIQTMPPADPKPLTPAEGLEVLAFLLRTSEMPSGPTPLPPDRARLAQITFERQKP